MAFAKLVENSAGMLAFEWGAVLHCLSRYGGGGGGGGSSAPVGVSVTDHRART